MFMKMTVLRFLIVSAILTTTLNAQSGDVIRIEKGSRIPVTVSSFGGSEGSNSRSILVNDLNMTSAFELVEPGSGGYEITANVSGQSLEGVLKNPSGQTILSESLSGNLRTITHQFADALFERLTGQKGIATSQVAFISDNSGHKEVYLMDIDGHNLVQVTRDNSIALSPHFSPDNRKIAFTSYKSGYADVWVIDLVQKKKTRIAYFPGVNSSPSFSPDGKSLGLILSRSGNPELYLMPAEGGDPVRLTRTRGTESSPTWSPGRERNYFCFR
jgi:TolB protein